MADMLVKLYDLPEIDSNLDGSFIVRRALVPEKQIVVDWVRDNFSNAWASECEISFTREPVSCFIAVEDKKIKGFACYESTYKNFFGPEGIIESCRGKGIGKVLLLSCLNAMKEQGYAYAIIGGVGPVEFYKKVCGAEIIEGSSPGIYKGML